MIWPSIIQDLLVQQDLVLTLENDKTIVTGENKWAEIQQKIVTRFNYFLFMWLTQNGDGKKSP